MPGSGSDRSGLPEFAPSGLAQPQPPPGSSALDAAREARPDGTPHIPDHQLLRKIGGGSYGEVWLARNTLGTFRAVKLVYRHVFEDHRPFEREFRGIERFEPISRTHEGLVDILQVGTAEDSFYYVMELADPLPNPNLESRNPRDIRNPQSPRIEDCGLIIGDCGSPTSPIPNAKFPILNPASYAPHTLRAELKARGRLPASECVRLGLGLARALAHLHDHELVHRDVKPSNIIFVDGVPKLADIGLVADLSDARSFVGTEGFIPPEGPGAPQADLYSLGKVLYEAATGNDRRDFPRLPTGFTSKAAEEAFLELNAVIVKACKTEPGERYRTAEEMVGDLTLLERGQSVKRRRAWQRQVALAIKAAVAVGVLALGVLLGPATARRLRTPPAPVPAPISIAVLPVRASGENARHNGLCERIADGFASALGEIEGVSVARRKWALALTDGHTNLDQFADRLAVEKALVVRLTRPDENYRLSVRLEEFPTGLRLWEDVRLATRTNLAEAEFSLLRPMTEAMGTGISDATLERARAIFRNNLEAYELVQEASRERVKYTREGSETALRKTEEAMRLDPRYLEIHRVRTYIYYSDADLSPKTMWSQIAFEVHRAASVDDELPWVLTWLGGLKMTVDRDVAAGLALQRRAAELSPGEESNLAVAEAQVGNLDEARRLIERATLWSPNSPGTRYLRTSDSFNRGQYAAALAEAEACLDLFPNSPDWPYYAARCLEQLGRFDEALEAIQKGRSLRDDPWLRAIHGHILATTGRPGEARRLLEELEALASIRYVDPAHRAAILIALGEQPKVWECLEASIDDLSEALVHPFYLPLRYDPYWVPLREDPRFSDLFRILGMEP